MLGKTYVFQSLNKELDLELSRMFVKLSLPNFGGIVELKTICSRLSLRLNTAKDHIMWQRSGTMGTPITGEDL